MEGKFKDKTLNLIEFKLCKVILKSLVIVLTIFFMCEHKTVSWSFVELWGTEIYSCAGHITKILTPRVLHYKLFHV